MTHRNITFLVFLLSLLITSGNTIVQAMPQTYEQYKSESTQYCNDTGRSWFTPNALIPSIDYPKFDTQTINETMARWREDNRILDEKEKLQLRANLDPITIGEFSGFKTLEVVHIGYRTHMNSLFACAVISSHIDTVSGLQKLIGQKIKGGNSEILENLKKIEKKLDESSNILKCSIVKNTDEQKKSEIITQLTNNAAHEYCYYRHYLGYLDSNIENVTQVQNIEKGIGQGSKTQVSTTISSWNASSVGYKSAIANEIMRADTTLPKALRTLVEMDQTYGVHILLLLVYDDYIRLRSGLSKYMNMSSQLYQKANNAQSTNK